MSKKEDPYKKGTKPPKTDELTAESFIEDVARKMDYGAGVTVEEAMKRIKEFSEKSDELKSKKIIAYKLCRKLKNGDITSLFINKTRRLLLNIWYEAESYPTKGFALRPFWHCTSEMLAPHLSKKDRVWVKVEMEDYTEFNRPENQGGKWYLANKIKIIEII